MYYVHTYKYGSMTKRITTKRIMTERITTKRIMTKDMTTKRLKRQNVYGQNVLNDIRYNATK
jgi:hypothetical protein